MSRRGLAARLLTTAALALVGSAAPSVAVPIDGAGAGACLQPERADTATSARSARGWQGRDHRALSTSERADIAARTARVLAQRNASLDGRSRVRRAPGTIPVYVHVMAAQDGAGSVSAPRVAKQIEVLNAAFSGAESPGVAADSGFRFVLADIDRFTNSDWHKDRDSTTYRARTRRGGAAALNVWLVGFSDLGIATFPWDYARNPRVDGVRVHYDSLPGNGIKNFDLGKSLVHEVGHWLGLYHTFEGGCTELNDEVADTPTQGAPTEGCPAGQDTCAQPGLDPVNNYMDYSYDACYSGFSPGQALRMQQMATAYRG